jgi:phosphate transport system substrate-binding protein
VVSRVSFVLVGALALTGLGCAGDSGGGSATGGGESGPPNGVVVVEAAPAAAPFLRAAAEQFEAENEEVTVEVRDSTSRRGLAALCARRATMAAGSRRLPIGHRAPDCRRSGLSVRRAAIANEALAVVTNPALPIDCLTRRELRRLWRRGSRVTNYAELDERLPNQTARLYGATPSTPAFELFAAEAVGGPPRLDARAAVEGEATVRAIALDPGGLGYLSLPLLEQNQDELNAVALDAGPRCVRPGVQAVHTGEYGLARPLYLHFGEEMLARPEVRAFAGFTFLRQRQLAEAAQVVPLSAEQIEETGEQLEPPET